MTSADRFVKIAGSDVDVFAFLHEVGALWTFQSADGALLALRADYESLAGLKVEKVPVPAEQLTLDGRGDLTQIALTLRSGAVITRQPGAAPDQSIGTTVRLVIDADAVLRDAGVGRHTVSLGHGWALSNASDELARRAANGHLLADSLIDIGEQDFTGSASFMGSKKSLLGLILPAVLAWTPNATAFLDLMTGSGVVAGAASRYLPTYASDAQAFARVLAGVHSPAFTADTADAIVSSLLPAYHHNLNILEEKLNPTLNEEDALLHSPLQADELADRYVAFLRRLNSSPWTRASSPDLGDLEVNAPATMFTEYYSDTYFGVRQCIEIDSLRYAVERLARPWQDWALGVLVSTVSHIATTYGGHFAQPILSPTTLRPNQRYASLGLSRRAFNNILKKRSMSVLQEFEARLTQSARKQVGTVFAVRTLPGPWATALESLETLVGPEDCVVVYVDPPYKREEYSRYYHVLESLVSYDYPLVDPRTKVPAKGAGARFASEFATRSRDAQTENLRRLVDAILARGWTCAWSYSDHGAADLLDVLRSLRTPFNARSVNAGHEFKPQGGFARTRAVREILVVLDPVTG